MKRYNIEGDAYMLGHVDGDYVKAEEALDEIKRLRDALIKIRQLKSYLFDGCLDYGYDKDEVFDIVATALAGKE